MLDKLFQPPEVKVTLSALRDLSASFPTSGRGATLVFDEARSIISRQRSDTVASIRTDAMRPRDLALLIIAKVAFAQLASGRHHVYRAVLDETGRELKAIFRTSGAMMVESGFIQPSEHHDDLAALDRAIRAAG